MLADDETEVKLSPEFATYEEFSGYIDCRIGDLEGIRAAGRDWFEMNPSVQHIFYDGALKITRI